tara:strand:+ start:414 stop:1649 length:1236 start_codon:yes stop_codon:yes gene_type:complete
MITKKCRICEKRLLNVIKFNKVALSGSFLKKNQIRKEKKYSLSLLVCKSCKHVQINNIINPNILFSHYDWETGVSKSNISLIRSLLFKLRKNFRFKKNSKIFEVASNDGTLLNEFKNYCGKSNILGIDPAKNLKKISDKKNIPTILGYFSYNKSKEIYKKYKKFDFCVARNVIAHAKDPNSIFKGVKNILKEKGIFVIEVPHLYNIFKDNQYDNIFHEHLGFHSLKSIKDLCNINLLKLIDVELIDSQGGSIRCYISHQNFKKKINNRVKNILKKEIEIGLFKLTTWKIFSNKISHHRKKLRNYLLKIKNNKKIISAYGASGKGQALLQFCGIDSKIISHVYDKSIFKQGKYTPGTHLKIVNPKFINKHMPDYLLLLSWNIVREIARQEKKYLSGNGKIIIPFPKPKIFIR